MGDRHLSTMVLIMEEKTGNAGVCVELDRNYTYADILGKRFLLRFALL